MASAPPGAAAAAAGGSMASLVPSIILGGAGLAGAGVSSLGSKSAAKTQAQTADKALAFAQQQEATKKQNYDAAMQMYQQQWNAWQQRRDALLKMYGVDVGPTPTMSASAAPPMASPGSPLGGGQPMPTGTPGGTAVPRLVGSGQTPIAASIASLMMPPQITAGASQPSASDLSTWSDWKRYGLA